MTDIRNSASAKPKMSRIPMPAASARKSKPEGKLCPDRPTSQTKPSQTTRAAADKLRSCKTSASVQDKKPLTSHAPPGISRNISNDQVPLIPHHPQVCVVKKTNKSMSFSELKRSHQELTSELSATKNTSRDLEHRYQSEVDRLLLELAECREANKALKEELLASEEIIREKNSSLNALQLRLDAIILENDRMADVLEASRIDAVTGNKIEKTVEFFSTYTDKKAKMDEHALVIDIFIRQLESTVLQLQEQNSRDLKAGLQP